VSGLQGVGEAEDVPVLQVVEQVQHHQWLLSLTGLHIHLLHTAMGSEMGTFYNVQVLN